MKRKLYDYFSPVSPPSKIQQQNGDFADSSPTTLGTSTATDRISITSPGAIPGLRILKDYVTIDEESQLIAFLDSQDWRTDLSRRVIHYGGTYCLMPPRAATPSERREIESKIYTAAPIPSALGFVISRMTNADRLYTAAQRPEYCIVNSYTGTNGISAHVENFRFDSPVTGLTLLNGDWMRFHELVAPDDGSVRSGKASRATKTGRKMDIWLPRRSLLVMEGEAREKWQHEILRGRKGRVGQNWRRVSLTFRTLKETSQ